MKQRNTSMLTALECADRIRTELADKPKRIEKRKQAAEDEENERSSARIKALLDRCVPEQRDDLPRIMVAINCPLNGIELQPGNDADAIPARLKEPVPPLRPGARITVER